MPSFLRPCPERERLQVGVVFLQPSPTPPTPRPLVRHRCARFVGEVAYGYPPSSRDEWRTVDHPSGVLAAPPWRTQQRHFVDMPLDDGRTSSPRRVTAVSRTGRTQRVRSGTTPPSRRCAYPA